MKTNRILGSLDFQQQQAELPTSTSPSRFYIFKSVTDIQSQIKTFKNNLETKRVVPIVAQAITILGRPVHFLYSSAAFADGILMLKKIIHAPLQNSIPIIGIIFTALETIKDILNIAHTRRLSCEIDRLFESSSLNAIESAILKDFHYRELLGKKVSKEVMKHLALYRLEEKHEHILKAHKLLKTQVKKAYFIHAISITILVLSAVSIVLSMIFAPPVAITAVSIASIGINYFREAMIHAYLKQPGHQLNYKAALPTWHKKLFSLIVGKCSGISSCSRRSWTPSPIHSNLGPIHSYKRRSNC
ncbi:MAG: hypothetical protein EB053_02495 [Chlamydiae bacterium]|nr:hypothetical protein [Chlamydiota bacterium]